MNFVILGLARLTRIYNKSTDLETLLKAMRNWKCSQEKVEARFFLLIVKKKWETFTRLGP